jgi:hypothetical protein
MRLQEAIAQLLANNDRVSDRATAKKIVETFKTFLSHNLAQTSLSTQHYSEILLIVDEEHMP